MRKEKTDIVIKKHGQAGVKGMTILDANALAEWDDFCLRYRKSR